MTCPICGKVMCDHSPTERGQKHGEMMNNFYSDSQDTIHSLTSELSDGLANEVMRALYDREYNTHKQRIIRSPRHSSASEFLEDIFGPLETRILHKHKDKKDVYDRESLRITQDGEVIVYNLVTFNLPTRFKQEHETILQGNPIGPTFQHYGHRIIRVTRCIFPFTPPISLTDLFRTKGNATVQVLDFYVDKKSKSTKYAELVEVYSPRVHF